jgi:hypothetical protein
VLSPVVAVPVPIYTLPGGGKKTAFNTRTKKDKLNTLRLYSVSKHTGQKFILKLK